MLLPPFHTRNDIVVDIVAPMISPYTKEAVDDCGGVLLAFTAIVFVDQAELFGKAAGISHKTFGPERVGLLCCFFDANMLGRVMQTVAMRKAVVMRAVPARHIQDFRGLTDKLVGENSGRPQKPRGGASGDIPPVDQTIEIAMKNGQVKPMSANALRGMIKQGTVPKDIAFASKADEEAFQDLVKAVQKEI